MYRECSQDENSPWSQLRIDLKRSWRVQYILYRFPFLLGNFSIVPLCNRHSNLIRNRISTYATFAMSRPHCLVSRSVRCEDEDEDVAMACRRNTKEAVRREEAKRSSSGSGKKLLRRKYVEQPRVSLVLERSKFSSRKILYFNMARLERINSKCCAFFFYCVRDVRSKTEREAADDQRLSSYSTHSNIDMKFYQLALSAIALCAPQLASASLTTSQLSSVFPGATNLTGGTRSLSDMVVTIVANSSEYHSSSDYFAKSEPSPLQPMVYGISTSRKLHWRRLVGWQSDWAA